MPRLFDYEAPYDEPTTRQAIIECLARMEQYQDGRGQFTLKTLIEPPLLATQYSLAGDETPNSFTITAGNRIDTYWRITFEWAARNEHYTHGDVTIDREMNYESKWYGDAHRVYLNMPSLLGGLASFKVRRFKVRGFNLG